MCFPWGRNTSVTGSLCSLQSVEMDFRSGNFPPGLLNPSVVGSAAGEAATWCKWLFNTECPTWERFLFNLFFTGHGVWLLLPLSFTILILYRLVGPPEVDEREAELRGLWEAHRNRFKSGANRASLRGVIKSSYLPEMGGQPGAREVPEEHAAGVAAPRKAGPALVSTPVPAGIDDGWEDVDVPDVSRDVARSAKDKSGGVALGSGEAAVSPAVAKLPPPRETVRVITLPGPTRVTVVGDRGHVEPDGAPDSRAADGGPYAGGKGKRVPILTLHAAGHNHRTCFDALERELANDPELGGGDVVLYHVDTPGHEEDAGAVDAQAFSLEAQAQQLLQVAISLNLNWFIGLGIGAGANVLLRFATDHPDKIAGLILANPSAGVAGRRERNAWLTARFRLSYGQDMKAARESLVPLSFPSHSSFANRYRAGLGVMHPGNVLKYIDASLCRDDVSANRLKALQDVWVLVLRGTQPPGSSNGVGDFLTSIVAGQDAEGEAVALVEKLRQGSSSSGGSGYSKVTMVAVEGGGVGGGLFEAKPREALAGIKLFLHKCL